MRQLLTTILLALLFLNFTLPTDRSNVDFLENYISIRYPDQSFDRYVYVEVKKQQMHIIESHEIIKSYPISTAKNGIGNIQNSECTPQGLLEITSKTGNNVPLGGIIKGPSYTGRKAEIYSNKTKSDKDLITTRAIRLAGLEEGKNKGGKSDTYERHIYIHGTPEEGYIGEPVSHGCIRMKNNDIIEFYDLITPSTKVLVLNL